MHSPLNRCSAIALSTGLLGLLAALPASSATASSAGHLPQTTGQASPSNVLASYELGSVLSSAQLQELLSKLPIGLSGPISPQALAQALSELPALKGLGIGHLQETLKSAIEGLGSGAKLEGVLESPAAFVSELETTLKKLFPLEALKLESLLGGKSISEELSEALGQVDVGELLQKLLGSGSEGPAKTLEALLKTLPAATVEKVLGSGLSGESVTEQTVQQLAEKVGMTSEELAAKVGATSTELPGTAKALTAPLSDEKALSVLDGAHKAVVDILSSLPPGGASGEGEGPGDGAGSGGSGAGGLGGSGDGGSGNSPSAQASGPTVIVNIPAQTQGSTSAAAKSQSASAGRVRVISRRVHGDVATIVIATPGRGTVALRNGDIRPITHQVGHAGRLTLQVRLSRAGHAAARRRRHGLRLHLTISFTPSRGTASRASTALRFK
jgi:hypothetical protein